MNNTESRSGEQSTNSWNRGSVAWLAGAVLVPSVLFAGAEYVVNRLPQNQYSKNFTDEGKCLDGTPYDGDNYAMIEHTELNGTEVVKVTPQDANNLGPSVLYITETDNGWYGFGDNQTGAFLVKMQCENIPTGY